MKRMLAVTMMVGAVMVPGGAQAALPHACPSDFQAEPAIYAARTNMPGCAAVRDFQQAGREATTTCRSA
jgi:hypothetical protein